MRRRIGPGDLGRMFRRELAEQKGAVRRGIVSAAYAAEGVLVAATPADTGLTRAGWRSTRWTGSQHVVAENRNDAPLANILELGSRPHWPPFGPIFRWLARVEKVAVPSGLLVGGGDPEGAYPDNDVPYGRISHEDPATELKMDDVAAAALGVARRISRVGTAPHFMVRGNLRKLRRLLHREVLAELEELARRPA